MALAESANNRDSIDALRAILLGEDRQAMDVLRAKLAALESSQSVQHEHIALARRAIARLEGGQLDGAGLRELLVPELAQAIVEAERADAQPLARALSPFVVSSIRSEIANSKEAMVEALYPITGRLVSASVKNAMAAMVETINQRVDEATSLRVLQARWQSWRTGQPVSAFLLARPGEVQFHSAMLMERDTGAPIAHVNPDGGAPSELGQSNLVSGLLAALSNLTEEVFTGADDELRTVDLNGRKITLRRSLRHLLVVEFAGTLSAAMHRHIDERFGEIVALSERGEGAGLRAQLQALMRDPAAAPETAEARPSRGKLIVAALAGLALLWLAVVTVRGWWLDSAVRALNAELRDQPALAAYPLTARRVEGEYAIEVSGVMPGELDRQALVADWQRRVGAIALRTRIAPVPGDEQWAALGRDLAALRRENRLLRRHLGPPASAAQWRLAMLQRLLAEQRFGVDGEGRLIESEAGQRALSDIAFLLNGLQRPLEVVGQTPPTQRPDPMAAQRVAAILRALGVDNARLRLVREQAPPGVSTPRVLLRLVELGA